MSDIPAAMTGNYRTKPSELIGLPKGVLKYLRS
jgi:hypothetical protein